MKFMRRFQQISLCLALFVSFSHAISAQTTVSDTKLMGLKGSVKSLVSSSKAVSGYTESVLSEKTKHQTTNLFDREGTLTETIYEGGYNSKLVYSKIDGYKTFQTVKLAAAKDDGKRLSVFGSIEKEEPIEPNEKLTTPDKRFDFRYAYETDNRGRITSERQYGNNGRLFRKRTFEYNEAGDLIKEREEDRIAVMTYAFKYDDKGNVVEVNETRDIKVAGSDSKSKIVYSEFKFDSVGNWTERKSTNYSKTDPLPQYNIPAQTYTFVNVEFRTITYY